ncbi:MAG: hypothetical protein J0L85_02780 [Zoogloea sp.]|nr:hypothetical protein [Zoogloea sp.]MCA0185426.1 hypothetical protein [Pseudomonadota bacterium]
MATVKARLEALPPQSWTKEDHYLALDFVVQRYLSADEVRTEAEWQTARARLQAKVDANINHKETPEEALRRTKDNERHTERQERLRAPNPISLKEFTSTLLSALSRYPFAPDVSDFSPEDIQNLWLASSQITEASTWDEKYQVQDAQSAMRIRYHPAVLETCQTLRRSFETLCRARTAGCEEVKVVVRDGCRCYGWLDGTNIKISDGLASFLEEPVSGPLLSPAGSECALNESPRLCHISLIPIDPPNPGDDPEFSEWLKQTLR